MQKPQHILVIASDDATRNLLEQFFIIRDTKVVATRTFDDAESIIGQWGLEPFSLAVIDTDAFGRRELEQKSMACHMLREWSMKYPILPVLFLGTADQKRAILKIRADTVQFLVKPLDLEKFSEIINDLFSSGRHAEATLNPLSNPS